MKFGFRSKMYLGIICLLVLFGTVTFLVVSRIMEEVLLEENRNRGVSIASNLAARVVEPILAMDFLRLKNLLDETTQLSDDIYYSFVLDAKAEPLSYTFKGGFPIELKAANSVLDAQKCSIRLLDTGKGLVYDYAVPVVIGEDRFGTVRLGLLQTRVRKAIHRLLWTTFMATGGVIAIAALLGTALARTISRGINLLYSSSEQAMRGNLDVKTAPLLKKNCWEIMSCGKTECPAYGELQLRCWYLAGTLCPHCVEGEYAKKISSCRQCPVYRKCSGDEIQGLAESFDTMARTLKKHISDLSAAEADLIEQRQLLRTILDATPDFVSLQDRDSVYQAANKAFCELLGKREEEIIGKTDFDLFSPEQARANRQEDLAVLETGEPLVKENEIDRHNGKCWLHVVKIPVCDARGEVVGLLCSGRDISEFKRVQERLIQAQKMEAIGQLTAGIAHEINTPLGIILGYAQLLPEEVEAGSQIYADLKTIEKHAKICRKIVSDLLRFSRHTERAMTSVNVNMIVNEVSSVVNHTFSLERIRLEQKLDPHLPDIVGDDEKLKQALFNLLNNSFDAIGSDGLISIKTAVDRKANEVIIAVADTGRGISEKHLDRIFDPFFTTKGVGKGTGLGLSVTLGIIRNHGGRIEVQSPLPFPLAAELEILPQGSPGRGTVFTIYLPVDWPKTTNQGGLPHGDNFGAG